MANQINILKPQFKTANLLTLGILILLIVFIILRYTYIRSNWDTEKCKNGYFLFAPFFGKNSKETIESCTENTIELNIDDKLLPYNIHLDTLDERYNSINNELQNITNTQTSNSQELRDETSILEGSAKQNIEYIKNALLKITNSLMINTAVNKGVLEASDNINNTSIAKISTNMENVRNNMNSIKEPNFSSTG